MADRQIKLFVERLADYIAGIEPALARVAPIEQFAHHADESVAADTYSILRCFGGPGQSATAPATEIAVQAYTIAATAALAMERGELLFNRLLDTRGLPLRGQAINGFVISGITNLTPPGIIGVDDRGRAEVTFNFECKFR